MIGRRCTHGNMFSRPVLIARTLSFTGKIKQETRFERSYLGVFLSAKYCGGYSGGEPPLPIPNREVKPAIADGTAPPGGRVGSCRSSKTRSSHDGRVFFALLSVCRSMVSKTDYCVLAPEGAFFGLQAILLPFSVLCPQVLRKS